MKKLVRDRIPEVIQQAGKTCETRVLDESAYRVALRDKLIEEAQEAAIAPTPELLTELADLWEVMAALMAAEGLSWADLDAVRAARRRLRGGFEQRLWLEAVYESGHDPR
ncbi:MAG: nucleoside triphosphate pyrophosphohydrolase [Leptolyngbyaceae cyanobacterium T60_A2020_046]|nr:nucleoside triphosphate pyrophosphohydrolase [Leptolyngbyaceae cyanobacterium T60_A2020_046]